VEGRALQRLTYRGGKAAAAGYPATVSHALDVPGLWRIYGRHAEAMLSAGPESRAIHGAASFVALSGAPHVDLNQAAIFDGGGPDIASEIVTLVQEADVPCLLGVSSTAGTDVSQVLRDGGFEPLPEHESLFYATTPPPTGPTGFDVRRIRRAEDMAGASLVLSAAHDYDPALIDRMWGDALLDRPDVSGWVAWDGSEAVSCVYITRVGRTLGVFDMMTPPRHRRRGAGRAVLTAALGGSWTWDGTDADHVEFWASPAGRPLYDALGFPAVDEITVWAYGAAPEDLAAVGAG
jgi:GNAT superfamily N-acetyltransferase